MKIILDANKIILSIAPTIKCENTTKYRFLKYVLFTEINDGFLITNMLTKEVIFLYHEEYGRIDDIDSFDESVKTYLKSHLFLVNDEFDDVKFYYQIKGLVENISVIKGINKYTIITTTDCNARCFYCYELGIKRKNMSVETAFNIAKYIVKNSKNKVNLSWFGGEPLYNSSVIDIICKYLSDNNIEYESDMISNGYFFDEEIVIKASKLWNLKKVQITLDGTQDVYNNCKKYVNAVDNPFEIVLNNIDRLIAQKIKVSIRMNMGIYNIDDIEKLTDLLINRYIGSPYIHIYPKLLFENIGLNPLSYNENELNLLYKTLYALEKKIISFNLFRVKSFDNSFKINGCMADSRDSIAITTDGYFTKCKNVMETNLCGNILEGFKMEHEQKQFFFERKIQNECFSCEIFPHCFNLKNCPTQKTECNKFERLYRKNIIHRRILKLVEKQGT